MENFDRLIANGGMVCYNSLAGKISHFKTGGSIELLLKPRGRDGLISALELLNGQKYQMIGAFTNTLVGDNGIKGALLSTQLANGCIVDEQTIYCESGANLINVAKVARLNGLSGLEELSGIPGTVGGGIYMNCGAYGRYMADVAQWVEVWDMGSIYRIDASQLDFGYRHSVFMNNNLPIIGCSLKLAKTSKASIIDKTQEYAVKRRRMQPEQLSLGCVFKKVGQESAGLYIEKAGLKGVSQGGAMISPKHANFIVNTGGATSSDYKKLVDLCESEVKNQFDIQLEREVIYLG